MKFFIITLFLLSLTLCQDYGSLTTCIKKVAKLEEPVEPIQICKDKDSYSCYNGFYSLQYCLLLNGCNDLKTTDDVRN